MIHMISRLLARPMVALNGAESGPLPSGPPTNAILFNGTAILYNGIAILYTTNA